MTKNRRVELATRMHEAIRQQLARLRASKVQVYLQLQEFKRSKLYRLLDVPVAARHRSNICAERRFPTWEDYLASLGRDGISFGYFAELERLEARFGRGFVRLCIAGVPVKTRRILLGAPDRVVGRVREIIAGQGGDDEKVRAVQSAADIWQSEHDHAYPAPSTPGGRASRYHRHARAWEQKLAVLVDHAARVPVDFRRGLAYAALARAWIDVLERHLEIGERLAREALSPELGPPQMDVIREMRAAWDGGRVPTAAGRRSRGTRSPAVHCLTAAAVEPAPRLRRTRREDSGAI